nr:hypothetical protein [Tanacetum cinerariifolium]
MGAADSNIQYFRLRRRLSEGDGEEKEKLIISLIGNALSIPSGLTDHRNEGSEITTIQLPVTINTNQVATQPTVLEFVLGAGKLAASCKHAYLF